MSVSTVHRQETKWAVQFLEEHFDAFKQHLTSAAADIGVSNDALASRVCDALRVQAGMKPFTEQSNRTYLTLIGGKRQRYSGFGLMPHHAAEFAAMDHLDRAGVTATHLVAPGNWQSYCVVFDEKTSVGVEVRQVA